MNEQQKKEYLQARANKLNEEFQVVLDEVKEFHRAAVIFNAIIQEDNVPELTCHGKDWW